jgi:tetratricopeptide (TPR) repeat protein
VLRPVPAGDEAGAPRERLRRLEDERARAADPEERARLDRRLARIWEDELSQSAPAFAALARAVRALPEDAGARAELRATAERCGAVRGWARILTEVAARLPEAGAREVRAELAAAALAAPELAALAWPALLQHHGEALAAGSEPGPAVEALTRLLALPPARAGAARLLEDAARASGDPRRLAEVLTIRLEVADPAEEGPLQAELGSLRERLGDLEGAAAALSRACALARPEDRPELISRVGRLHAARGALDLAQAWLSRAAEAGEPEALAELARLLARRGDRPALLAALLRQAAAEPDPARRAALFLEVANMRAEQGEVEGAVDACRQLLAISPDDPQAAPLLARLLGVAQRWDELDLALGREAEGAARRGDAAAAAALRVRQAEVRRRWLGDEPGALEALTEALRRAPRHPAALAALESLAAGPGPAADGACALLEPVYTAERRPDKLAGALEWRLARAPGGAGRAAPLIELAKLRAGPLGDPGGGFEAAAAALREDPDSAAALALVQSLSGVAGQPPALLPLLGECAARARRPERRAELRRVAARLLGGADPEGAAEAWRRLLAEVPGDAEALRRLAAHHRARGEPEPLAAALRELEPAEPDAEARAALLEELSQVLEGLSDPGGAAACARRLLSLRPGDVEALARLDRLCAAAGRWAELAEVLEDELAAAEAARDLPSARSLRLRLAALRAERLLDREGAVALAAEALDQEPASAEARALLEAALDADAAQSVAASALERACERTGDLAGLSAARARRAAQQPDPTARKALLLDLAALRAERLGDATGAFDALADAFREDPADRALRRRLEELSARAGRARELAELYEAELGRLAPPEQAALALAVGELAERELGDPGRAARAYEKARALDAGAAAAALPALERLHAAAGRHAELAEVLEERARSAQGPERAALLFRLGRLQEEELGQSGEALCAYEAARACDPGHREALLALARLDEAAGRRASLCERLSALRASEPEPAERARLAAREGELCEELGDATAAARCWREALGEGQAAWPAATRAERWFHLGELRAGKLGDEGGAAEAWGEALRSEPQYLPALRALRTAHAARGEREPLCEVLRQLALLEEGEAEGEVRLALAEALLAGGEPREAVEQARRALAAGVRGEPDLRRLTAVFDAGGSEEGAARAAEARAEVSGEAAGWMEAADRWGRVAGAGGREAAALARALALDPALRRAWERLRALRASEGDWRARVALDEAFAPSLPPEERRALRRELARLQEERLGEPELAFLCWCRALQEAPGDAEVLAEARRLGEATGQPEELAAVIEDLAESAAGAARARLLLEVGALRDGPLEDAAGAAAAWEAALEAEPASPAPLAALAAACERRGDARGLAGALERLAERVAEPVERAALLLRVAQLHEEQLGDPPAAEAALRRALDLAPGSPEPLAGLAALLERQRRFADLCALLTRARDEAPQVEEKLRLQLRVAALKARELGDEAGAVDAYAGAAALDPSDPEPWRALAELHRAAGRAPEECAALERLAARSKDVVERAEALGRAAALAHERLGDPARAIATSEELCRLRPGAPEAVARLARLYRSERRFEELAALLGARVAEAEGEEALALRLELARLQEVELGDAGAAVEVLREAVREAPDSAEALRALCALEEGAGRHDQAAALLSRLAEREPAGDDRAAVLTRLGVLQAERRGDAEQAAAAFRQALAVAPGFLPALRAARGLAEREGDRGRAEQLLEAEARHLPAEEAAGLYLELARRRLDREDGAAAARACAAALERAPGHLPALRLGAELALSAGELPRAHLLLAALAEGLGARAESAELAGTLARLGWTASLLGRDEEARAAFRRALEHDPRQRTALEGAAVLAARGGSAEEALRAGEAWRVVEPEAGPQLEAMYREAVERLSEGRAGAAEDGARHA